MSLTRSATLLLPVILAFVIGCRGAVEPPTPQAPQVNSSGYYALSPDRLAEMLTNGDDFALMNVHIPYDGEIAGTDAHVPYNEITNHLDRLPAKDAPIVLYCRNGGMSTDAAKALAKLGYTNVWELNGGMAAWAAAGYELANE